MLIDTAKGLSEIIDRAMQADSVAIDTEFVWERTYYPRLGLVQIGVSEDECYLVDTPAIGDVKAIGRLIANPGVVKILHDAQQDLIILNRVTGALPKNIFDTRCAAGFAGLSSTISLSDLLRQLVGVKLSKTESRTDWLKRPLTERQVEYAIDDIRYMHTLRDKLLQRMKDSRREVWMEEERALYEETERYEEKDPYTQYKKIKGKRRMSAQDSSMLKELAAWREETARKENRPRGHIVSDEALVNLCRLKPKASSQLKGVKGLYDGEVRRYGSAILKVVKKGLSLEDNIGAEHHEKFHVSDVLNAQTDFVLAYMKGKSIDSKVDLALVSSRAEVTALLSDGLSATPENHRLLRGWRREFLGEELLQLLAGKYTLRLDRDTGLPRLMPAS
ncbi:MAG: ribonuclease D [Proteobacteria bacterium]|nr:ribonuclease D [Pseudomonadota bacterium]